MKGQNRGILRKKLQKGNECKRLNLRKKLQNSKKLPGWKASSKTFQKIGNKPEIVQNALFDILSSCQNAQI